VLWRGPAAVQMHHDRNVQLVAVPHDRLPSSLRLDRRPGEDAVVPCEELVSRYHNACF
jgi:hypothetical protein